MNVVTFNDGLESAIAIYPEKAATLQRAFGKWQTAPLFDYVTTYEREKTLVSDIEALEEVPMPFNKILEPVTT